MIHVGGWFPWHERRSAKKIGIKPRYAHGWLSLRIGRWIFWLSWDRREKGSPVPVDYDAIP